ncbi:DUF481 domain-containing protein [bacterium SCSIO 12741]|nr:DUF481 domain-containing protein [bacterium SCSIO 12741]
MKTVLLFLLISLGTIPLFAQQSDSLETDSLQWEIRAGMMGQWQKGNLNQWSVMPNALIRAYKKTFLVELMAKYSYVQVEGITPINDFWTKAIFQYRPTQRLYPVAHSINGFAKSFGIDHSFVNGVGGGVNLIKNNSSYLQLHALGTYLNLQFSNSSPHSSFALGSLIRARLPISKNLSFLWELSTYHSTRQSAFWGGGNEVSLEFKITRRFFALINHQLFYNNIAAEGVEKLNTQTLLELSYQFRN